jgi:hypothetical protein
VNPPPIPADVGARRYRRLVEAPRYWPAPPPIRHDRYQRPLNPLWQAREAVWRWRKRVSSSHSDTWFQLTHPRATIDVRKPNVDLADACPVCAAGWKQTGPLQVPPSALPRRALAMTHDDDLLLRDDALEALDGLTAGLTLVGVEGTDGSALPWTQVVPNLELPRVVNASNNGYTADMQCIQCQRDGFFDDTNRAPLYGPSALSALPTNAYFVGSTERRGVSSRRRLVAARVFARREAAERLLTVAGRSNLTSQSLRVTDSE